VHEAPDAGDGSGRGHQALEVYSLAAGFYVALLKNRFFDEAEEFQEWFLESFDIDLES
jgi:hypothetical protein